MAKAKMLITGGTGLLGTDLAGYFSDRYEIWSSGSKDFDISKSDEVIKAVENFHPDIVLHSAAIANVDLCETDHDLADRVNVIGSENVAFACDRMGAHLVYYSTDYVFDGTTSKPYTESDKTNPINYYGYSKLEGEKRVADLCPNSIILRVAWLYSSAPKAFINKLIISGKEQVVAKQIGNKYEPIKIVSDQIGSPTYTYDIAGQTEKIINEHKTGLYHCVAEGAVSRFDLARHIFEFLSLDVELKKCSKNDFEWQAPRPLFTALENNRLKHENINLMRDYKTAIEEYLTRYYKDVR